MINEMWIVAKAFILRRWKFIVPAVLLFVVLLTVAIPLIRNQMAFQRLPLEDVQKVSLVQYLGDPFSSSVEWMKQTEEEEVLRSLIQKIREGEHSPYEQGTTGRQVLFFHLKDGSTVPGFLDGNKVGFEYGALWVETDGLDPFLEGMTEVPLVEIRDPAVQPPSGQ